MTVLTCDSPREDREEASPSAPGEPALAGWLRPSPIFARLRSRQHGGCASGRPWSCDKEYSKYLQGTPAACGADAARLQARIHACEKDCVHIRDRSSTRGRAVCLNLNLAVLEAYNMQHAACNRQTWLRVYLDLAVLEEQLRLGDIAVVVRKHKLPPRRLLRHRATTAYAAAAGRRRGQVRLPRRKTARRNA